MTQMTRPRPVPSHTYIDVSQEQGGPSSIPVIAMAYLTFELLVSGEVIVITQSLLQEC